MEPALDFRQLRYYATVARLGSIAAAARELNLAQPALSRHVASLEASFGAQLFYRLPRGVALTRLGRQLADEAEQILAGVESARRRLSAAVEGRLGVLKIGVMPGQSSLPMLSNAINGIARTYPEAIVQIETYMSHRMLEAIRASELDAGFVAWRSPLDPLLTGHKVLRERMAVAVPRSISVGMTRQSIDELLDQPFLTFPRSSSPSLYDAVAETLGNVGLKVLRTPVGADLPALLGLVAAGLGCALVPASFKIHCPSGIEILELTGLDIEFDIELVSRSDNTDALLSTFISIAKDSG